VPPALRNAPPTLVKTGTGNLWSRGNSLAWRSNRQTARLPGPAADFAEVHHSLE